MLEELRGAELFPVQHQLIASWTLLGLRTVQCPAIDDVCLYFCCLALRAGSLRVATGSFAPKRDVHASI